MTKRIVYILGAGASYDAGGPLLRDFFSREGRKDYFLYPTYFNNNHRFKILESIYIDWASKVKNPDIESFFKDVELKQVTKTFYQSPSTKLRYSADDIEKYLIWYISSYVRHSIASQHTLPIYYYNFASNLIKRGIRSSILTFNYDMIIEKVLFKKGIGVHYQLNLGRGLNKYKDPNGVPLLKLHGSLNWLTCSKCGRLEISEKSEAHRQRRIPCKKSCGYYLDPYIIPPGPSKGIYLGRGNPLWKIAQKLLERADKIVVIGYSLPEIDSASITLLGNVISMGKEWDIVNRNASVVSEVYAKLDKYQSSSNPISIINKHVLSFKDYVDQMD